MSGLPKIIEDVLKQTECRRRHITVLGKFMLVLSVLLLAGLLLIGIDWLAHPEDGLRQALSWGLWMLASALLLFLVILPWLRRESLLRTARRIEASLPEQLHERLSAAVALHASAGESPSWMVQRTIALAAQEISTVQVQEVVPVRPLQRQGGWLLLCALPLIIGMSFGNGRAWWGRALLPWADILRPSTYRVRMLGEREYQVLRGDDLEILAEVSPLRESAQARIIWSNGRHQQVPLDRLLEEAESMRFRLLLRGVIDDAQLRIYAGDGRSQRLDIRVIDPPRIVQQEWTIYPPAYTGISARSQAAGDLDILSGSQLALSVDSAGPQINAMQLLVDDQRHALVKDTQGLWHLDGWQPEADARLRMLAIDQGGHEHILAGPWNLRLREDLPPRLELSIVGDQQGFAADETLLLQVRAEDDVGLEQLSLHIYDGSLNRQQSLNIATPHRGPWRQQWPLDMSRYNLQPGQILELRLHARDMGGQEAVSSLLGLHIEAADWVRERRRSQHLRGLQESLLELRQELQQVQESLAGLTQGMSEEVDVREIFSAELRQAGRRTQRMLEQMSELTRQWRQPRADALGRAESGLRGRADTWQQVYAQQLRSLAEGLHRDTNISDFLQMISLAQADMDAWIPGLALAAGASESVVASEQAQQNWQQSQRSQHIIASYWAWSDTFTSNGLLREVFRRSDLRDLLASGVAPVVWDDARYDGSNTFSMRWRGQIRIDNPGLWQIRARVDDGLRVLIGGQDIFAGEAWRNQPPTDYRAEVEWQQGWQDIQIEFYQDGGGALLELALRDPDGNVHALSQLPKRHHPQAYSHGDLISSMARVSADSAQRSWQSLREHINYGHSLVRQSARWAEESNDQRMRGYQTSLANALVAVPDPDIRQADQGLLASQKDAVRIVASQAQAARERLFHLLREWQIHPDDTPVLADSRSSRLASHLREQAEALRRERDPEQAQGLLAESEVSKQALAQALADDQRRLQQAMARSDMSSQERQQLRQARRSWRQLADEQERFSAALDAARQQDRPDIRREARDMQNRARDLERHLASLQRSDPLAALSQALRSAEPALIQEALRENLQHLQDSGQDALAEDLRKAMQQGPEALRQALVEQQARDRSDPPSPRDARRELQELAEEAEERSEQALALADLRHDAAAILAEQMARATDPRAAQVLKEQLAAVYNEDRPLHETLSELGDGRGFLEDLFRNRVDFDALAQANESKPSDEPADPAEGTDSLQAVTAEQDGSLDQMDDVSAEGGALAEGADTQSPIEDPSSPTEASPAPDLADLARRMTAAEDVSTRLPLLAELRDVAGHLSDLVPDLVPSFIDTDSPERQRAEVAHLQERLQDQRQSLDAAAQALQQESERAQEQRERALKELQDLLEESAEHPSLADADFAPVLAQVRDALEEGRQRLEELVQEPTEQEADHSPLHDILQPTAERIAAAAAAMQQQAQDQAADIRESEQIARAEAASPAADPVASADPAAEASAATDDAGSPSADPDSAQAASAGESPDSAASDVTASDPGATDPVASADPAAEASAAADDAGSPSADPDSAQAASAGESSDSAASDVAASDPGTTDPVASADPAAEASAAEDDAGSLSADPDSAQAASAGESPDSAASDVAASDPGATDPVASADPSTDASAAGQAAVDSASHPSEPSAPAADAPTQASDQPLAGSPAAAAQQPLASLDELSDELAEVYDALMRSAAAQQPPKELPQAVAAFAQMAEDLQQLAEQQGVGDEQGRFDIAALEDALSQGRARQATQAEEEHRQHRQMAENLAAVAEDLAQRAAEPLAAFWADRQGDEEASHPRHVAADWGQRVAAIADSLNQQAENLMATQQGQDQWRSQLAASQEAAWQAMGDPHAAHAPELPRPATDALQQMAQAVEEGRGRVEQALQHGDLSSSRESRQERGQERLDRALADYQESIAHLSEHLDQELSQMAAAQQARREALPALSQSPSAVAAQAAAAQEEAQALQRVQEALTPLASPSQAQGEAATQAAQAAVQSQTEAAAQATAQAQAAAQAQAVSLQEVLQSHDPQLDQALATALSQPDPQLAATGPALAPGHEGAGQEPSTADSTAAAAASPTQASAGDAAQAQDDGAWSQLSAALADAAAAAAAAAQAPAQAMAQGEGQEGEGLGDGSGGSSEESQVASQAPEGVDQAEWARLSERERRAIRDQSGSHFAEEERAAIRAYTRRLLQEE